MLIQFSIDRIGSSYRSKAYCAAIAAGGVKEWDFLYDQYLITDSAQHRQSMRFVLCSFNLF